MTKTTLVDTNVLLDVLTDDPNWAEWSSSMLAACLGEGDAVINPLIYAEVSVGFDRIEDLEDSLPSAQFRKEYLPWSAAFLAGKALVSYRRRGGNRTSPLPDFYIGAHAAVSGYRLLTRDRARYATYFPSVELLIPE